MGNITIEELDRLLENGINKLEEILPKKLDGEFDPDRDLQELEFLIENPGAALPDRVAGNSVEDEFGRNIFNHQLIDSQSALLNAEDKKSGVFELKDTLSCLEYSHSKAYLKKGMCEHGDDFVDNMSKDKFLANTKEWCDAWVKRNEEFDVSEETVLFDDHRIDMLGRKHEKGSRGKPYFLH